MCSTSDRRSSCDWILFPRLKKNTVVAAASASCWVWFLLVWFHHSYLTEPTLDLLQISSADSQEVLQLFSAFSAAHDKLPPISSMRGTRPASHRQVQSSFRWERLKGSAFQAPPECFYLRHRLAHNISWWRSINANRKILRTLTTGVKLEFAQSPRPFKAREIPIDPGHRSWIHTELDRGIEVGTFEAATCFDYVAPAFVHVQPGGKKRLVFDFGSINRHCIKMSCRYEGLKDLRYLLCKGDWMFSLDLTDAFWHIPVAEDHRKFLTFSIDGRILQCSALPFGWTGSPLTFTKVMRCFVQYLRSKGIRCLPYLDDLAFFVSGSFKDAIRARDIVEDALNKSGLTRKPSKGHWEPTKRLPDHLGMVIDSVQGTFVAPARRCNAVAAVGRDLLCRASRSCRRVPTKLLRSFAGMGASLTLALRSARFRLRSIYDCMDTHSAFSILSRQAITDIQWWSTLKENSPENGMPIWQPSTTRTLWCDASGDTGWGAQLLWNGRKLHSHGFWRSAQEFARHITWKELRTLRLALTALLPEVQSQHILLWEDNMPVVHMVLNGTSRSPELMTELRQLWSLLSEHNITLHPRYIRSQDNPADFWSRWKDRSAWQFLPSLFARLTPRDDPFTLDPFGCRATALVPRYCSLRPDPGAIQRDGFTMDWSHEHVWLNPPWELIPRALYKLRMEQSRGTIIVPFWPSQTWWPMLMAVARCFIDLPPARLCVRPAHGGMVEPLLHRSLRLLAVQVDGSLPPISLDDMEVRPWWTRYHVFHPSLSAIPLLQWAQDLDSDQHSHH